MIDADETFNRIVASAPPRWHGWTGRHIPLIRDGIRRAFDALTTPPVVAPPGWTLSVQNHTPKYRRYEWTRAVNNEPFRVEVFETGRIAPDKSVYYTWGVRGVNPPVPRWGTRSAFWSDPQNRTTEYNEGLTEKGPIESRAASAFAQMNANADTYAANVQTWPAREAHGAAVRERMNTLPEVGPTDVRAGDWVIWRNSAVEIVDAARNRSPKGIVLDLNGQRTDRVITLPLTEAIARRTKSHYEPSLRKITSAFWRFMLPTATRDPT